MVNKYQLKFSLTIISILLLIKSMAQTDVDAIMMSKNELCIGPMFQHTSWNKYWEGSFLRTNENLGTVSGNTFAVMGAMGVSDKFNVLFNIPYMDNKASAGTLKSMSGLQDASLFAKWMPIEKKLGKGTFSLYTIGGISIPITKYVADYLPLSIGMQSKTLSGRLLLDYQQKNFFFTASATYTLRSKVTIDRTAYYTNQMILSNEVAMPDVYNLQCRTGYRSSDLIAEAFINRMNTVDGFDITKNNMPFLRNKMESTIAGINVKYYMPFLQQLAVVAGGSTTLAGRNIGKAQTYYASLFYVIDFTRKKVTTNKK